MNGMNGDQRPVDLPAGDPLLPPEAATAPGHEAPSRPRTLLIESIRRVPEVGAPEELTFEPGVNLIVGPPNAGKSKWLSFIDFVLGDTDPPEDTLGPELATSYRAVSISVRVYGLDNPNAPVVAGADAPDAEGHQFVFERRWKEPGMKGKVFVDGDPMTTEEFSSFLLTTLGIPLLHYPKGDPYAPRAWPALSWRTLFRHIYREDRFWSDLADRQPDAEQHAALMQFLGLASQLFSDEYGDLVGKRKEAERLRVQKESYMALLGQITQELGRFDEFAVAITPDSVAAARDRLTADRDSVIEARAGLLTALAAQLPTTQTALPSTAMLNTFGERLSSARSQKAQTEIDLNRSEQRLDELRRYRDSVHHERELLDRAETAATVLSPLRVTNCPACDRPIQPGGDGNCYVCHQPDEAPDGATEVGAHRIAFERDQLAIEETELLEVIAGWERTVSRLRVDLDRVRDEVREIEDLLRPTQIAVAAVLPPDLGILDQRAGSLDEQLRTITAIERSLARRDALTAEIDRVTAEADALDAEVAARSRGLPLDAAATLLADGFNSYFNALGRDDPMRWQEGGVTVRLRKRDFDVEVNGADWHVRLGRTLQCFFLNAYHYALISLSIKPSCHYPGLAIIDFPPTLADGRELTDEENYLIEPFIGLVERLRTDAPVQVIVAGRAFVDLRGANRIPLTTTFQ